MKKIEKTEIDYYVPSFKDGFGGGRISIRSIPQPSDNRPIELTETVEWFPSVELPGAVIGPSKTADECRTKLAKKLREIADRLEADIKN